jgi:hypothetical protein
MSNLFESLEIDIWDFIKMCLPAVLLAGCLTFDISDYLNTRDGVSKDDLSPGYHAVKFNKVWGG